MSEALAGAASAKKAATQRSPRSILFRGLFALIVVGWVLFLFTHPAVLPKIGIGHYRIEVAPGKLHEIWFLDTYAILASNDTLALGENPYLPNRLDYLRRPHSYGPGWLYLRHLGLTRSDTFLLGSALAAAFVLVNLGFLRPTGALSLLWCSAIVCSTPVLAAVERGNNDLVVFLILAGVVPLLLKNGVVWRWLAVPALGLATALKYYPAVAALVLLACGTPREIRWRMVVTAVMLVLIGWHVISEVPFSGTLPAPRGILSFGAIGIFQAIGITGVLPQVAVMLVGLLVAARWWRSPSLREWLPSASLRREWMYFILGAAILTGCFFVGQHFAYRWVFTIWLAPFLWSASGDENAPSVVRKLTRLLACLLVALLWVEGASVIALHGLPHDTMMAALSWVFLGLQPLTWIFFICLVGFLVHFFRLALSDALAGRVAPRLRRLLERES